MSYIVEGENEPGYTYWSCSAANRTAYEQWVGKLSKDALLSDINRAAVNFLECLPRVLNVLDPHTGKSINYALTVNTFLVERFYEYAVEGLPNIFMCWDKDVGLREISATDLKYQSFVEDFGYELQTMVAYNELFEALEESFSGSDCAFSIYVVLNTFTARIKLDQAKIDGGESYLSIEEVSLLAGMKSRSVRNIAHKELGAFFSEARGMTLVPASSAEKWLRGRRKFKPSIELKTEAARKLLSQTAAEWFN